MTETGSGVVYDGVPLDGVEVRVDADGEITCAGPMLLRALPRRHRARDAEGWLPPATSAAGSTTGGSTSMGAAAT